MKSLRTIVPVTMIIGIILTACAPKNISEPPAVPTDTVELKTIQLYYPNGNETACYADSYIEVSVPADQYNAETALNLLFAHELTDEEKARGLFNNLNWLKFGMIEYVVDEDGSLSYEEEAPLIGEEYLKLSILDENTGVQMGVETDAYLQWSSEAGAAGSDAKNGGICWLQTINEQITKTIKPFFPEYFPEPFPYGKTYYHDGGSPYIDYYFRKTPVTISGD